MAAANIREELTRDARPMLLILLGTTGLVLLLACANVANLTLARLLRRERELALRAALGADRGRLIRQLLTESSILSLAGGVVGIGFAWTTVGLLTDFVARFTPRTGEVGIDWRVLAFTLVISIGTGLLFGTVPALSSRADLANSMKQGSKGAGESPRPAQAAERADRGAGGGVGGAAGGRRAAAHELLPAAADERRLFARTRALGRSLHQLLEVPERRRADRVLSRRSSSGYRPRPASSRRRSPTPCRSAPARQGRCRSTSRARSNRT